MKLEDATNFLKAFSSNPTVIWGTLFTVIPSVFFGGYTAITRYNEMVSVIDENKEIVKRAASQSKELAELRTRLEQELSAKTIELNAIKERQVQNSEAMIRVSEKASDAIALARETKAIAEGSQKESRASLAGIRSELETTNQALRTEMQVLRRATVNPLGK